MKTALKLKSLGDVGTETRNLGNRRDPRSLEGVGDGDEELEERGDDLEGLEEEHEGVLEEDLAVEHVEAAVDGRRSCSCLSPGPVRRFSVNRGFFKTMTHVHTINSLPKSLA